MFTLEYSYWFDYMLPGLDRLGLPIPLGGTSNHFRADRLRSLGGWDAFNVTEDADLGLRAAAKGYTVGIIASTTFEEACSQVIPFVRQRTRWIKGYMQTAIVHSRRPVTFTREAGVRSLAGLVLLIAGTPATFLAVPLMWFVTAVWLVGAVSGPTVSHLFPHPFDMLAEFSMVVGNLGMIGLNALAVVRRRMFHLLPFALLAPLYWVLHSIAAWRALDQLIRRPFVWEKTPHGLLDAAVYDAA
jgi:cellulose synthase/poly-beta-1,6-N-acetylglucosamine synthase-like glycosyltransferase